MNLYEAIYKRKSTRNYSKDALPKNILENINKKISSADTLFHDSKTEFRTTKQAEIENFLSGLIGSYGKIEAPHYIVAFSNGTNKDLVNLGYTLEKIVLEITRLELSTCWMGSHFDKEALKNEFGEVEGLKPQALLAFGMPEKGENALRPDPAEASRKDLSEILLNNAEGLPEDWSRILDAARMAPSAMNSQPWRFDWKEKWIHMYLESGEGIINKLGTVLGNLEEMNKIDAGIALRHIKIAADQHSKEIELQKLEKKNMDDLSYIASIRRND